MALGVVQGEHARPARPASSSWESSCAKRERAPVLVQPEVRVGVDDFGVRRAQVLHLGEERSQGVGV